MDRFNTFCGESCEGCDQFESGNCVGCMSGGSMSESIRCAVRQCCKKKKVDTCSDCSQKGYCATRRECTQKRDTKYGEKQRKVVYTPPVQREERVVYLWGFFAALLAAFACSMMGRMSPGSRFAGYVLWTVQAVCYFYCGVSVKKLGVRLKRFYRLGSSLKGFAVISVLLLLFFDGAIWLIENVLSFDNRSINVFFRYLTRGKLFLKPAAWLVFGVLELACFAGFAKILKQEEKEKYAGKLLRTSIMVFIVLIVVVFASYMQDYFPDSLVAMYFPLVFADIIYLAFFAARQILLFYGAKFLDTVPLKNIWFEELG